MRLRPALVLAAPAGVLAGHAIGYLAAPGPTGDAAVHHGYLALVLAVVVPLAALAVGWAATGGARRATVLGRYGCGNRTHSYRERADIALGPLVVAQWVLFTGQEVVEHAIAGHGLGAALHSPALWCGLAAQVATATVAIVLLRVSAVAGARLVAAVAAGRGGPLFDLPAVRWRPGRPLWSPASPVALVSPSRGPPAPRFV